MNKPQPLVARRTGLPHALRHALGPVLLACALFGIGWGSAHAEPTLKQVYETAQSGQLAQAQVMMQQVLVAHPDSAKAHFVQAELLARQGKAGLAREALATAEKLAPGLPFAKPQAVQALRQELNSSKVIQPPVSDLSPHLASPRPAPVAPFPWTLALALGGAALAFGVFLLLRKNQAQTPAYAQAPSPQPAYANQNNPFQGGLAGAQRFGMAGADNNSMAPAPSYAAPPSSGLGTKVMGGLATGLAVGAGVMAAQAIGKSLMGHNDATTPPPGNLASNNYTPLNDSNNDLGGQNFGINDSSAWDDDTLTGSGGGGDWDS
ncbi:MAG: hypothetical protein ACI9I0_002076 [Rhodoferax sp.]